MKRLPSDNALIEYSEGSCGELFNRLEGCRIAASSDAFNRNTEAPLNMQSRSSAGWWPPVCRQVPGLSRQFQEPLRLLAGEERESVSSP